MAIQRVMLTDYRKDYITGKGSRNSSKAASKKKKKKRRKK